MCNIFRLPCVFITVRSVTMELKATVIMPVYNEEKTVYGIIRRVLAQSGAGRLVIVYDTRSTDNTLAEIRRAIRGEKRALLFKRRLRGKGSSVRYGLGRVRSGPIMIQDADEEYYPEDYPKLLRELRNGQPVFGYRTVNYGHAYGAGKAVSWLHTWFFNLLFRQSVMDVNAGYKVFTKEMLHGRRLKGNGFELDMEIAAALAKNGYRIASVPIRYKGRTFEEGKKIGAGPAIRFFFSILHERLTR